MGEFFREPVLANGDDFLGDGEMVREKSEVFMGDEDNIFLT